MGNFRRNVTYFYQFHNGAVGATAGFLRMELRGDNVKITINIQEPYRSERGKPVLYLYHQMGDILSAVKICEVERQGGVITMQTRTPWRQMFDTGRDLYTFDGAIVMYNDNDYYLGDFADRDRSSFEIRIDQRDDSKESDEKNESALSDDISQNEQDDALNDNIELTEEKPEAQKETKDSGESEYNKDILEEKAGVLSQKEIEHKHDKTNFEGDSLDGMLEEYPRLPMYNVDELFDCVRINPRDIGKLDIGNWKLGSNSFLTHGYYTYKYLMLGKMRFEDGNKHAVLGVPGVYSNREKYLANMFGFYTFIPVKKTGQKTGQFGYWIVEINC